jgi:hypothetical protein
MSDLKVGDKVYVKTLGLKAILKEIKGNKVVVFTENNRMGFGTMDELEEFIEPKYKVGDIVIAFPATSNKDEAQIVKCALNKKKKTYFYMAFCMDQTGYAVLQEECYVRPVNCTKCGTKI